MRYILIIITAGILLLYSSQPLTVYIPISEAQAERVGYKDGEALNYVRRGDNASASEHGDIKQGEFTAYNIHDDFTPSTIMANGERVHPGAIACPSYYAFGTRIRISGVVYTCKDRMARRFREDEFFDIYKSDIIKAKKFGRQSLSYEVIK